LPNEGDTSDIISAVVPAILCSPPLCRYLYLSILKFLKSSYSNARQT